MPGVIERMIRVPDAASIAGMRFVARHTGLAVGGSTGTNIWGALKLAAEMHAAGERGSVVTLICDRGDRYLGTYYDDSWLSANDLDIAPFADVLDACMSTGEWTWDDRCAP